MKGCCNCATLLLLTTILASVSATDDKTVAEYVSKLKDSQTDAIAADSLAGELNPLFSGYASLNQKVRLLPPLCTFTW